MARGEKIKYFKRLRKVRKGPRCVDLFSGAGGLAEGFRQAGWSVISANDMDPDAAATFRENFPEASFYLGPVSALSAEAILADANLKPGELECLIGGPPCQSFSYNNHQRSASGARAKLFHHYLRLVGALKPKILLMENVPGMLTIGGGKVVETIQSELKKLGYNTEVRVLYAEDFGVPQARRRAFVVGSRVGSAADLFPIGTHGPSPKPSAKTNPFVHRWEPKKSKRAKRFVTVGQAIGDLPRIGSGKTKADRKYKSPPSNQYQRLVRAKATKLLNHQSHKLTDAMLARISHVPEGGNWLDIPRRLLTKGMRRAHQSCHTKRYGRLSRSGLASTLLTKCDPHWGAYVHPTQNRTISVREAARLQGFPDHFQFVGPVISKHYTQVGNAVPVPLARSFGAIASKHVRTSILALNKPR